MLSIELFDVKTNPEKSVRNLGVICDKHFIYHIQDLRCSRRYLDLDSAKLLAAAIVPSRLNYFSLLLYGFADTDLTELQRIQNRLACVVSKSPPFTPSVPLFRSPNWLSLKFRILFKIISFTYKPIYEKQPFIFTHACPITPIQFTEIKHRY